jgi:hypothetical protein
MANASSGNSVTWIDGLAQTSVRAHYGTITSTNTNTSATFLGVDLDSQSARPNLMAAMNFGTASGWSAYLSAEESFPPQLGLHYIQAMEYGSATATFFGIGASGFGYQGLTVQSEY